VSRSRVKKDVKLRTLYRTRPFHSAIYCRITKRVATDIAGREAFFGHRTCCLMHVLSSHKICFFTISTIDVQLVNQEKPTMKLNLILLVVLVLLPMVAQGRRIKGSRILPSGSGSAGSGDEGSIKTSKEEGSGSRRRRKYACVCVPFCDVDCGRADCSHFAAHHSNHLTLLFLVLLFLFLQSRNLVMKRVTMARRTRVAKKARKIKKIKMKAVVRVVVVVVSSLDMIDVDCCAPVLTDHILVAHHCNPFLLSCFLSCFCFCSQESW
jgi:uncharacterized membrane protein